MHPVVFPRSPLRLTKAFCLQHGKFCIPPVLHRGSVPPMRTRCGLEVHQMFCIPIRLVGVCYASHNLSLTYGLYLQTSTTGDPPANGARPHTTVWQLSNGTRQGLFLMTERSFLIVATVASTMDAPCHDRLWRRHATGSTTYCVECR